MAYLIRLIDSDLRNSNVKLGYLPRNIQYYSSWEDICVIQEALKINSNDVVLSLTSSGCNILNFLLFNPKKIYAVDFNPYQNYLLDLKIQAIKNLNYEEFLELLGISQSNNAIEIYQSIRAQMDEKTRTFWDSKIKPIKKGLIYAGEHDIKAFGSFLRFLIGKETIEGFFKCNTIEEQTEYYQKKFYGFPWKLFLKFSYNLSYMRLTLCLRLLYQFHFREKKPSEILKYIRGVSYPKNPLRQIEFILTKNSIIDNYFASLIFLNRYYNEKFFPPYLKKESFSILKERIDRIEIKTISIKTILNDLPDNSITKFNFSNSFDWFDEKDYTNIFSEIVRVGVNNGRIFFLSNRIDRVIPKNIKGLYSEKEFANQLLKKDRTILYSNFQVGKITK